MEKESTLASDLLRGARAIAEYTGLADHQVEYLIKKKEIPAFKKGNIWFARKSEIDRNFSAGQEAAPALSEAARQDFQIAKD
jgi:Helix-turn-helix domain